LNARVFADEKAELLRREVLDFDPYHLLVEINCRSSGKRQLLQMIHAHELPPAWPNGSMRMYVSSP